MKDNTSATAPSPPKSRLFWGVAVLVLGNAGAPLCIPLLTRMELSAGIKTAVSGLLLFGIPELSILAAVAILGKTGFAWVKSKALGFLKRLGPPAQVSRSRYCAGLVIFTALLVWAWLEPYVGSYLSGYADHRIAFALSGDALLLISLIVLGGEFWDKLRALFVQEAKVMFPSHGAAGNTAHG